MKQASILLIEDDLSVANAIMRYMKEESLAIKHIDNGKEGLEYITTKLPSVVLLDLHLPDMSGMEILKNI